MLSVLIVATVLVYTWLIAPITPRAIVAVPVIVVLGLALLRAIRTGEWGFNRKAFLPALSRTAMVTTVAAVPIVLAGWRADTWHDAHDAWNRLVLLIPWALGQQFV